MEIHPKKGYILSKDGHLRTRFTPQHQLMPYYDSLKRIIHPTK